MSSKASLYDVHLFQMWRDCIVVVIVLIVVAIKGRRLLFHIHIDIQSLWIAKIYFQMATKAAKNSKRS